MPATTVGNLQARRPCSGAERATTHALHSAVNLKANTPVSTPEQAEKALRELSDIADTYARRLDDLKPFERGPEITEVR